MKWKSVISVNGLGNRRGLCVSCEGMILGERRKGSTNTYAISFLEGDPKHIAFSAQTLRGVTEKNERMAKGRIFQLFFFLSAIPLDFFLTIFYPE